MMGTTGHDIGLFVGLLILITGLLSLYLLALRENKKEATVRMVLACTGAILVLLSGFR